MPTPRISRLTGDPSILQALLVFLRFTSPRLLVLFTALALGIRVALGGFTPWDLLLVGGMLLTQPFFEWAMHVFVLHFKPSKVGPWTVDLHAARMHRIHHREPWRLDWVFIPLRTGARALAIMTALWYLALPTVELFATAMAWTFVSALAYEWIHYLTHTNFRPRTAFFRERWRLHRLHHFKNERHWLGVTSHLGDRVLGTYPDPNRVESSPTCRSLGVDAG